MRSSLGRWISSIVSISLLSSLAACNQFQIVKPVSKSSKITTSNGSTSGGSSGGLSYSGGYFSLTKNTVITPIAPTLTPGAGSVYSISPALPSGLALSSSTGTISGTPTSPKALTNYTITAVGGGKTLTAQFNLEVVTTHPTNSSVTAAITSATANGTSKLNIVVRLMTANNTPVPNNQIVLYSSRNATDIIEAVNSKTDATGKAYFTVKSNTAGTSNLFAADINDQISIVPTATVQFVPGTATQLIYTQAPTSTVAGATFTVEVTARDANGNTATGFTGNASIVSSDPNAALPASPVPFTNGVAQISGNVLKTMGSQSVNVASGALSAGARSITVNPGSASRLSFQIQPSTTATAGADLSIQPSVVVTDAHGNLISNSSAPVTLEAFSDTACSQVINGALTAAVNPVSAVSGVASFNGVKVLKTHALRIGARSTGGLISACSNAVAVSPAAPFAANSGITGTGPVIANGVQSSAITISIQDSFNNPIPGVVPTFSATDTGGSNQYGTCSATDSTGTAACSLKSNKAETKNLSILTPVARAGGVVTFSSSMLASFTVSAFPGSVVAGTPHSLTITALDSAQNIVTGYTGTVNITSDAPQAALGPSITFDPADQGQKTLSGLILKSAGSWKIEVSDSSAPSLKGSQNGIVVTPSSYSDSQSMLTVATANVTSGSSVLVTLTARDAYGNTNPTGVPEAGSISFTSTTNAGTGSFGSVTATGSGVFTSNFTGTLSGLVTLGAQISGVAQTATTSVTVDPATASQLVFSGVPATINAGTAFNLGVTAKDPAGNVATGFNGTVTITSSDAGATLPTPALLSNGTGTFSTVLNTATTSTVTAASGALSVTSSNITVNALAATQLVLTSIPSTQTAGNGFTFTVTAKDSLGNIAPTYGGTVAITSSDPQASLPTPAQLTNGVGTFTVTLKTAGAQTLNAGDGTRSIQSGSVAVTPATASQLVLSHVPGDTAGDGLTVTVTAKDSYNNVATGYPGTISWSSNDPNPDTSLPSPSTLTAGSKTFSIYCLTAGNRTFTVNDGTLSATGSFTVTPAPTASLTLSSLSNVSAGTAQNITVSLKDAYDNITPSTTCTLSFSSNDPQAVLPSSASFNGGTGTHSVTFKTSGASQSLTATCVAGANTFTDSKTAAVQPGAYSAAQSVVTASTASVASGGTLTATLTTKDDFGNTNPSGLPALGQVVFTSTASPGSGTFGSATSSGNGVYTATFMGVNAGSVTLGATLASVAVGNTASISVQSGAATTLAVTSVPTTTTAGSAFNVVVTARDAQNNVVTGFSDSIQFTSTDGNALLPSPGTLTNGTGTFSITLRTAGSQTLTFTPQGTSGLPATISNSITVNPAAATQLLVTGLNAAITAGDVSGFTVTARDSFGNTDTNFSGTLTTTSSDPIAVLPPQAGLTSGIGSFNITLKTSGAQTFSLSDGGALATSNQTVTVSASIMATATSILTASNPSVVSGSSITGTLTTKDAYGNLNPSNANVGLIALTATRNSVTAISGGKFHTCIIDDGALKCFGLNSNGQIGTGSLSPSILSTPQTVFPNGVTHVSAGNIHTCAVVSGALKCFGGNISGQIGNGSTGGNVLTPYEVFSSGVTGVAAGTSHTCAIVNGALKCFGASDYYQSGTAAATVTTPFMVFESDVTAVAAGGRHTCAVVAGALKCFGGNDYNQVRSTHGNVLTPVTVFASGVTAVAGGDAHTCAVVSGSLRCFGSNTDGQIGNGSAGSSVSTPYTVYQSGISHVSAGFAHTCAVVSGSLMCFGLNNFGQIGNGSNGIPVASPYTVFTGGGRLLSAGGYHTCAITQGDLKCFGLNTYGSVGNGNTNSPILIPYTVVAGTPSNGSWGAITHQGSGVFTAPFTGSLAGTVTLGATIATSPTSNNTSVTVLPGVATQLIVSGLPASTVAGNSLSFAVTARDSANNVATGFAGTVTFGSSDGQANVPSSQTLTSGTATLTATLKTSGNQTLTATAGALSGSSNTLVNPAAYDLTQSAVTASSAAVTSGSSITVTLTAKDAYGNPNPSGLPASTSSFAFTSTSVSGAGNYGSVNGLGSGVYQASFSGVAAGSVTLGATILGSAVGVNAPITVNPAPPASFEFVSMPSSVTAGSAFTFTVNARDLNNNLSTGFNSPVTLTSTDTQAVLSGPVTFAGGSGSFTATLKTAPQKILTVTNGSVSSSHTMNVDPGAASQLVLGSVPSSTVAGTAFTISITARDPFGNTATGYTASVGLTSNDPLASLPIAATLTNGTGMRTVTLRTSGNRSITASDGTLTRNSSVIAVTPGAYSVAQSSVTLSSNVLRSGLSLTASLNATDAFGNSNPTGLPAASGVAFSLSGGGSGAFGPVSGPVGGIYQALFTGENNTNNGASSIGASISGVAVGNPAALTIFSPLAIIPGSFSFPIGRPLALNFSASGGSPGYTYSIVSGPGAGSGITSGGSLNLSNIPRSAGQQTVVRVTDSQNDSVDCIITHVSMIGSGDTLASATHGNETFIGGTFRTLSPHQARGFMPLDPATGAISDLGMASGFDGTIRAIVTSGRFVYVGGNFTSYQGRPAQNIAKIDTLTGEMEEGFAGQASTNGAVNALALVGQNLYLGGEFTSCSSGDSDHLCAIDALSGDFLQDPLNIPNHMPPGSTVNALVSDGVSLFAGGYFESYQDSADIQGIVKIPLTSGAADPSFHTMKNLDSASGGTTVNAISLVSGDLYVGGDFTQYRGDSRGVQIVKLNASTGAIDFNFNSFTPAAPGGAVYAIAEDGGQLYLGGDFESYRDDHRGYRLARLDRFSGDLNTLEFNTQVDLGPGGVVRTLSVLNDTLLIGGDFTDYRGDSRGDRLALLSKHTGAMDTSFNGVIDDGPDLMVRTIQYHNGRFYVGGDFSSYRGIPAQYLAKIDSSTGLIDMSFTQPMGPDERVRAIAYHPLVGLFVGGDFTRYRGNPNGLYLIKLDPASGNLDTTFNSSASGPNARVQAIAIDWSSSAVYIGGMFTTYRNNPAGFRLVQLDPDNGALNTNFNRLPPQGPSADVTALALGQTGLYVGGNFTSYRSDTRGVRLIKVNRSDGSLDTTFNSTVGAGPNGTVLALSVDPASDKVYAGGGFSSYRGTGVNNLLSVNPLTGALNTAFSLGGGTSGSVYALVNDNSGSLYVGGDFTSYRGAQYPNILRLDSASGVVNSELSGGISGPVYTLSRNSSEPDSPTIVGGSFKNYLDHFTMSGACAIYPDGTPSW